MLEYCTTCVHYARINLSEKFPAKHHSHRVGRTVQWEPGRIPQRCTIVHGYPLMSLRDFDPRKLNPTSRPSRGPAQQKLLCVLSVLGEKKAVRIGVCVPFAPLAPFALNGSKDLAAALLLCGPLYYSPPISCFLGKFLRGRGHKLNSAIGREMNSHCLSPSSRRTQRGACLCDTLRSIAPI
jgi:hypothetical protein